MATTAAAAAASSSGSIVPKLSSSISTAGTAAAENVFNPIAVTSLFKSIKSGVQTGVTAAVKAGKENIFDVFTRFISSFIF